jgi:hypothetical protein
MAAADCVLCHAWRATPYGLAEAAAPAAVRDVHRALVLGYFCARAAPDEADVCTSHAAQIDEMRAMVERAMANADVGGVS